MRKRMVLNEDFYQHYPYRGAVEQTVRRRRNYETNFDCI